ncbi:hypothetical protein HZC09_06110 [Candidatus Micrarchaeota archaeon]|nr:hypothetical protein [Candidatus Micrarchaeota archaeon]
MDLIGALDARKDYAEYLKGIVLRHHETPDGTGYPHRMMEDKINPFSHTLFRLRTR